LESLWTTARRIVRTVPLLFLSSSPLALLAQEIPCAQSTDVLEVSLFPSLSGYADCTWLNPYIVVFSDHLDILDRIHHHRYTTKRENLRRTLSRLPHSAWRDGKVVALALEEDADTSSAPELSLITESYDAVSKELAGGGFAVALVPVW
jgi:hypothetical protein